MNAKHREVLQQHRHFLSRNIVWSDQLIGELLSHGVITDTILKDIQNGTDPKKDRKHRHSVVSKLIEVLPLKGSGTFQKFCEVLYMNGHSFIADFLRDEENSSGEVIDIKEIFRRIPALDKYLKDPERKLLEAYVYEKVKESALKGVWSKEAVAREKDKAIEAKQRQLEDAFDYEEKEKALKAQIAALEKQLAETKGEVMDLKSQLRAMGVQLRETEDKFKADFGVQMKYNTANENAIRKLEDKYKTCELTLEHVEKGIHKILYIPERNSEKDQMAKIEFRFAFVAQDFDKLLEKHKLLLEVEKQNEQLLHEKNYILSHLGHHSSDNKPSLLNAYRDFAVRTDEDMTQLKQKIEHHSNIIEGQQEKIQTLHKEVETHTEQKKLKQAGTVWQNALLNVMRKQLNDVKHDNRMKETRIHLFETEIGKLKARIAELEAVKQQDNHVRHRKHSHKERLTPEMMMARMEDADSDIITSKPEKGRRNSLLPPIYPSPESKTPPGYRSPNRHKQKPVTNQRNMMDRSNVAIPEGLITHQLHLANRGMEMPQGKLSHGAHALGDLKMMGGGGKPNKYAHIRS